MSDVYVECQSCTWKGMSDLCGEIEGLLDRVAPGEIMPYGECPECGALCHPETPDLEPHVMQSVALTDLKDSALRTLWIMPKESHVEFSGTDGEEDYGFHVMIEDNKLHIILGPGIDAGNKPQLGVIRLDCNTASIELRNKT